MPSPLQPFRPVAMPSLRPWAGSRLGGPGGQVGELWLAGPALEAEVDGVARSLEELAGVYGEALVGRRGLARLGARFPLIVKLIDAADWLSLQVHPDDALARELYGPDAVGKAEAWLVLDADPGAELVTGPAEGLSARDLLAAVDAGEAGQRHCRRIPARAGEALILRPGTLHAIGAGTFVYEIEQPSDLTFRISDWGRTGRPLHRAEALRALVPDRSAEPAGSGFRLGEGGLCLPEFRLELPELRDSPLERAPAGETCEVITPLRGTIRLDGEGWSELLDPYQTLVVPAAVERYTISGRADALACVGGLP